MKGQSRYNKKNRTLVYIILIISFFATFYFFYGAFLNFFIKGIELKENIIQSEKDMKSLILENNSLKRKLSIYQNPENLLFFYKEKNKKLMKELGYLEIYKEQRKIFPVILDSKSNIYSSIFIKDLNNDVESGDLVFYKFNLLIGTVVKKKEKIAKLQLFSNVGVNNYFHLYDGGVLRMKVEGSGEGSGVIKVVAPRDIEFVNQKVFLTSIENNYHLVAELVDEKFEDQDTNKILYFKILGNLDLLSQVEIQKSFINLNNE